MKRVYLLRLLLFSAGSLIFFQAAAQKMKATEIKAIFERTGIVNEHFTGFALFDEETGKMVYEHNADKYFVPASNTKMFTLYTALNMLGDSIPGLRYVISGDSLFFWGTGDPTFLHPDLNTNRVLSFLKNTDKKLFYSVSNYLTHRSRNFLIEPMPLPVGDYHYPPPVMTNPEAEKTIQMLELVLEKEVHMSRKELPRDAATLYSILSDSLYRRMMLPSDNYLAEQIVMICGSTFGGPLNVDSVRNYSQKNFLADLPAKAYWVNGAGFAGNLFTPRTIIALLIKIRDKVGNEQRLHQLFPAGGVSGTIAEAYQTDNGSPFVFAKTGTLQYVHNQSGFLVTRKGKRYIFSFMNNNFTRPTPEIRAEMVRVMTEIHEKY